MSVQSLQPNYAVPTFSTKVLPASDLIKEVALTSLKELTISLSIGSTVIFFVASPVGASVILSSCAIQTVLNLFIRIIGAFAKNKAIEKGPNAHIYERIRSGSEWLTSIIFACFTGYNGQMLIHESGHALASILSYTRPRPNITIYPFVGGHTQFHKTTLNLFGKWLGPAQTTCFIVASGPALTLLISSALLAIGLKLKEKSPLLAKYLVCWSLIDFVGHAYYAYSAFSATTVSLKHDFVHLSIFGLSPTVAVIGILAIPILIHLGMQKKSN